MGTLFFSGDVHIKEKTPHLPAMLKLFAFFIPFVCLVASFPQGPSFNIAVTSPNGVTNQIPIREKFPEGIDGAPFTPANECDGYSCSGLEYELIDKIEGKSVILGQCQNAFPEYEDDIQSFCFVNADSSCDKKPSSVFPGKYVSAQACRADNAPKKRFIDSIIIHAIWNSISHWF